MSQNDLLYLSIAQHYGGISPLLDFSEDIKTALFFMTENASFPTTGDNNISNYSSIYIKQDEITFMDIINQLEQLIQERLNTIDVQNVNIENIKDLDPFQELTNFNNLKKIDAPVLIPNKRKKIKLRFKDNSTIEAILSISNLNIVAQKGCFVFHYDENEPLRPLEKGIECVDIHKSLMPYIKKETLKRTTIESIYPKEFDIVRNSLQEALSEVVKAEL